MQKRNCVLCKLPTVKWQRINGGKWHCYDGCKSTTGWDHRVKLTGKQSD
jgi:hypothetical protein